MAERNGHCWATQTFEPGASDPNRTRPFGRISAMLRAVAPAVGEGQAKLDEKTA